MTDDDKTIDSLISGFPTVQRDREAIYIGPNPLSLENPDDIEEFASLDISLIEVIKKPRFVKLFGHKIEAVPDGSLYLRLSMSDPNAISLSYWNNFGRPLFKAEMMRLVIGDEIFRNMVVNKFDDFFAEAHNNNGLLDGRYDLGVMTVGRGGYAGKHGQLEVVNTNVEDAAYNIKRRNLAT